MIKKFYALAGAILFVSGSMMAQLSQTPTETAHTLAKDAYGPNTKVRNNQAVSKQFDDPIWENDFSNAADWTIGNEVGNSDNWVIGTDGPAGPQFGIAPIESPTAGNGFALFDSDILCSGDQNAWIANANPIDLSGQTIVALQFQTYFRDFIGSCFVETSTNGTVWGNTVEVLDLAVNDFSANPELVQIPLNGIAGSSTAYIRFRYVGGCDYAWMVDDVEIGIPSDYDLRLVEGWYDAYIQLLESPIVFADIDFIPELEYSAYAQGQVRPLSFTGQVVNLGAQAMPNVVFNVTLTTPQGVENFVSAPLASLASGDTAFIEINDVVPAAFANGGAIGNYTVAFSIIGGETELDESNNTVANKTFNVNPEYMANDLGNTYSGVFEELANDVIWGTRFMYETASTIDHIQFQILSTALYPSMPGDVVYLNVREGSVFTEIGPGNELEQIFGEDEVQYTLSAADFTTAVNNTTWITMMFPEEIPVTPGVIYQAELQVPPGGAQYLWIPQSNAQESGLAGTVFEFPFPNPPGPNGWFSLGTNAPNIRLGKTEVSGVNDQTNLTFKIGQNYPNPSTGSTRIDWELLEPADNVQFRISDITGKTVYSLDLGNRPAGIQESLELNLNLAAGSYQYGLQIGNHIIVRKMVITK